LTAEIQKLVEEALERMPERTRLVFVMSRYENKPHAEIADTLGITVKGVEFHISKATKLLRVILKDYLPSLLLMNLFRL
ncbi:MAG: RNA polymerase sigma-70 factor, partial [Bacteroides sp.]|nr:RNA polymerase sigma-70 factor [Bacteroides sp.]